MARESSHFHICRSGLTWIGESRDQLCRRPYLNQEKRQRWFFHDHEGEHHAMVANKNLKIN